MFADDERQESWRVEGVIKRAAPAEPIALTASARTRAAALESLAHAWGQDATTATVPSLDWTAIAQALTAVRAI
jgi:hypothetical protein